MLSCCEVVAVSQTAPIAYAIIRIQGVDCVYQVHPTLLAPIAWPLHLMVYCALLLLALVLHESASALKMFASVISASCFFFTPFNQDQVWFLKRSFGDL